MKRNPHLLLSLSLLPFSVLGSNIVRIEIPETGLYEISYGELIEMGFADPAAVGLAGRGGRPLPSDGSDDAFVPGRPVPVAHADGRLYFYGLGPDLFSFQTDASLPSGGRFVNEGLNIYSSTGYYYLSDAPGALVLMAEGREPSPDTPEISAGVGFVAHEIDLAHNSTLTGNLYWGERFNCGEDHVRSWAVNLPDADPQREGVMECVFYVEKDSSGTLSFGTDAPGGTATIDPCTTSAANLTPVAKSVAAVAVGKGLNNISVAYESADNSSGIANLDYWVLSYTRRLSAETSADSSPVAFPEIPSGEFRLIPATPATLAIDISDPATPRLLPLVGGSHVGIAGRVAAPTALLHDTSKPAKRIGAWQRPAATPFDATLSAMAEQGADLLVISTEAMLPHAERIAELHRETDSMEVAVVTLPQIYAELSDGLPDPQACRRLVRMFAESDGRVLRNLLFVGPFLSDVRGVATPLPPCSAAIAPQAPAVHNVRGAYPVSDIYGITSRTIDLSHVEAATINIGVGVLPFYNDTDADLYIAKLRRYISDPSMAIPMNEWLYVGGTGDNHTHDTQAVKLDTYVRELTGGAVMSSVLAIDAYGAQEAHSRFVDYLNAGKGVAVYLGHSSPAMIGQNSEFLSIAHLNSLNNHHLPLLITAGCSATVTDQGRRGVGEAMVLSTPGGAIAALTTLRETWSGQNFDFVKQMLSSFYSPASGPEATLGEIYAEAQTKSRYANDLSFILIGDPAIRIPAPRSRLSLSLGKSLSPGGALDVTGVVLDSQGFPDRSFNGKAIVKLTEPERQEISGDYYTKPSDDKKKNLTVTYADDIAAVSGAEVKDGVFSFSMPVPASAALSDGAECRVYVSAFSNYGQRYAAAAENVTVAGGNDAGSIQADVTPPAIEDFRCEEGHLSVTVSDNAALLLSSTAGPAPLSLTIDGASDRYTSLTPVEISDKGRRCVLSAQLPQLPPGSHTASVEVADMAGNRTRAEFTFTTGAPLASLTLATAEKAVDEEATFLVGGSSGPLRLVIIGPSGKVVRTILSDSTEIRWDRRDDNGSRLAPGLYKASVSETSPAEGRKASSGVIPLPLI